MTAVAVVVHPAALEYPLMPEDELASLAEDMTANGQRDPIIVDQQGRLVDGRNRLEACRRAEIEPIFATIEFDDDDAIADYVLSVNVEKRSLTSGQKAMFRAINLARQGKRSNGRWKRGSVLSDDITDSRNTYKDAMNKAGLWTFHEFLTETANLTPKQRDQILADPDLARAIAYIDITGETACNNVLREQRKHR